jgi:hypothetical protein
VLLLVVGLPVMVGVVLYVLGAKVLPRVRIARQVADREVKAQTEANVAWDEFVGEIALHRRNLAALLRPGTNHPAVPGM